MAICALIAIAACASPRPSATPLPAAVLPPAAELPVIPGTRWATPRQPWRAPASPWRLAVHGDFALLQGFPAWLALTDLRTGRVIRERRIDGVDLQTVIALRDGRWLAVGLRDQMTVAFALQPDSLVPTEVVVGDLSPPRGEFIGLTTGAVEFDGGVVISGPGLALALYDPATWKVRRVIDPVAHWRHVLGGGTLLYAVGRQTTRRFDLATGGQADVAFLNGAGATYTISRASGGYAIELPGRPVILVDSVNAPPVDVVGERFAVRDGTQVRVHALADGKQIAAYELGEAGRSHDYALAFAGDRLVVWVGGTLRVIDLRTGPISPAGSPPYDTGAQLAISDDGVVTHHSAHVVRVVAGTVASSTPIDPYLGPSRDRKLLVALRGHDRVTGGVRVNPGDVASYATMSEHHRDHQIQRHTVGNPAALHTWQLEDGPSSGWLGSDGTIAVTTRHPDVQLWRLAADASVAAPLGPRIHGASGIDDIDVDAQLAAVTRDGATYLLDLASATFSAVLPRPACDGYGDAGLERGGVRVYVRGRSALAVFCARPARSSALASSPPARSLWCPTTTRSSSATRAASSCCGIPSAASSARSRRPSSPTCRSRPAASSPRSRSATDGSP